MATILARILGYLSPAETSLLLMPVFGVWGVFVIATGLWFAPKAAPPKDLGGAPTRRDEDKRSAAG